MIEVIEHPSPNFNHRPPDTDVTCIVLHGTAGTSVSGDLTYLCDEAIGTDGEPIDVSASYHYLIGRHGKVYQLVDELDRAWHAGYSEWRGHPNVNDFSIGVGMTNRGPMGGDCRNGGIEPYTTEQVLACADLVVDICARYGIPWREVATHAQVSPGRKTDPWLHFPLGELAGAMLSYQTVRT